MRPTARVKALVALALTGRPMSVREVNQLAGRGVGITVCGQLVTDRLARWVTASDVAQLSTLEITPPGHRAAVEYQMGGRRGR